MFSEAITAENIDIRSYTVNGVYNATSEDRTGAIAVVTAGFSTDPVARWVYPDPSDYLTYFPGFVRAFAGGSFEAGTAFVAKGFKGAALWLPPCIQPDAETVTARFEATVDESIKPDLFEMLEKMSANHPQEPHWYLPMIAVDTLWQGRGIGTSLMRYALDVCDAQGLPAYLESSNPKNIPLYERFGFTLTGTIKAGSAPPVYPMFRRARAGR